MQADEHDRITSHDRPETELYRRGRAKQTNILLWLCVALAVLLLIFLAVVGYNTFYKVVAVSEPISELHIDPLDSSDSFVSQLIKPLPMEKAEGALYDLPADLPSLEDSDAQLLLQLTALESMEPVIAWSQAKNLARSFASLIYNLAEGEVPYKQLPLSSPKDSFSATGRGASLKINPDSYARYSDYAVAISALNADRLVTVYRFFWPVFKVAFAEFGESKKSLHNEMLRAIDHLLATPEVNGDVELVRPSVLYKYADPKLERLSAAQKQFLRLGPNNGALIKTKLMEIKERLNTQ